MPDEARQDAVRRLTRPEGTTLEARNRAFHRLAVDGVTVEYRDGGRTRGAGKKKRLALVVRDINAAGQRGEELGLSDDELAFYDALGANDSAVAVLGDEVLWQIAVELVETVRNNVSIDWTLRENVRAHIRRLVKRILRKHNYPPDKQEQATQTVLEQAGVLSAARVASGY